MEPRRSWRRGPATPQATVSTPLSRTRSTGVDPTALTIPAVLERSDPWSDDPVGPQRLEAPAAALREAGVDLEVISPRARTNAPRTRRAVDLGEDA